MIHTLPAEMKDGMQETINSAFNTHLSPFKSSIVEEMSQNNSANQSVMLEQLEELFERYLGSQRLHPGLVPPSRGQSPTPSLPPYTPTQRRSLDERPGTVMYTPEMLKANSICIESLLIPLESESTFRKVDGITGDVEVTHRLQLWWASTCSDILWVQGANSNAGLEAPPLAEVLVAVAREACVSVLSYTCRRLNTAGSEIPSHDLLFDLLCSLIWQYTQTMTDTIYVAADFSIERFNSVKQIHIEDAILAAMDLLHDLICVEHPNTRKMIVLEGLQLLDYGNEKLLEKQVRDLIEMFLPDLVSKDVKVPRALIKTLILTDQQTPLLMDLIDFEHIVDASNMNGSDGFLAVSTFEEEQDKKG
jgi:hypothetical protein